VHCLCDRFDVLISVFGGRHTLRSDILVICADEVTVIVDGVATLRDVGGKLVKRWTGVQWAMVYTMNVRACELSTSRADDSVSPNQFIVSYACTSSNNAYANPCHLQPCLRSPHR
jgi:hypothetical protein